MSRAFLGDRAVPVPGGGRGAPDRILDGRLPTRRGERLLRGRGTQPGRGSRAGQRRGLELCHTAAGAPKPAFELWLPMATFVAAIPMAMAGHLVRERPAGRRDPGRLGGPARVGDRPRGSRTRTAWTDDAPQRWRSPAGLLVAVLGPFLVAVAGPDSTTPFLVFGTLAAWLMPRADHPVERWLPGLALGVALALAWLSRQEAVWLGAGGHRRLCDRRRARDRRGLRPAHRHAAARFGVPIARTLGNCLSIANYARLVAALGASRTKRMLLLAENLRPRRRWRADSSARSSRRRTSISASPSSPTASCITRRSPCG